MEIKTGTSGLGFAVPAVKSELQKLEVPTRPSAINRAHQLETTPRSGPYYEGRALGPEAYAQNQQFEILERISKSCVSMQDTIRLAKAKDPGAFQKALDAVGREIEGKNVLACKNLYTLAADYDGDLTRGLTTAQADKNRELYGRNELDTSKADPAWKIFLYQFKSFVIILLLVASIVSLSFGEYAEGIVILIIVFLNATLATYMEKSASNALAKLASMAAPSCLCLRNGKEVDIPATDIVRGDVVFLATGDSVPADVRVVEAAELKANEALLTGEPEDCTKTLNAKDPDAAFATNMCFASTSITNGTGKALVVSTGMDSQVGRIAAQLQKASTSGSSLTPLQKGLNRLGGLIGIMAICVLVVIVVVAILTKYEDPSHPDANPIMNIILIAISFAVSAIPEGLPMVVTICLSIGAKDMVRNNANVRKLPAVETLGCCSVVCSDKTGTLTEGKMTAVQLATFESGGKINRFGVWPTKGFDPNGGIFVKEDLTDDKKEQMNLMYNREEFQKFNTVLTDYARPESVSTSLGAQVHGLCLAGGLNSHGTQLLRDPDTNRWITKGNMSEGAIVVVAAKARWSTCCSGGRALHQSYSRFSPLEVPFNSSRKMMASVHKLHTSGKFDGIYMGSNFDYVGIVKGAPDFVLPHVKRTVHREEREGCSVTIDWDHQFGDEDKAALQVVNDDLAEGALRVLLFTIVPLNETDLGKLHACESGDERIQLLLSGAVTLLGVMGSVDPPRAGVREAVNDCRKAGIRVIMITGDQKVTAAAIAKDIGIIPPSGNSDTHAMECARLHLEADPTKMHILEDEFDQVTDRVCVFARAQPDDKIAIVQSLQRQGHTSAMTGDGVNDAPALQAADIGVAMGISGTDVAKGASEMVLLDDNFCTIVRAIEEGRKIYSNIQKFVAFLLGTNIGEIIYLTICIVVGMKMPVEALQIIFLNLMSDGCPAVALSREPEDAESMLIPPRPKKEPIVTADWWIYGILPHCVFEALCVILALMTAMYLSTGSVLLSGIEGACLQSTFDGSDVRYFCQINEYRVHGGYAGWVTSVDFLDDSGVHVQWLGALEGFHQDKLTPEHLGFEPDFFKCAQKDDLGWCLPTATPPSHSDVSVQGSLKATTQSFLTAVYAEMFRAYSVRSWAWAHSVFNRNPWIHLACSLSATATLLLTIIPGVNTIFAVTPIQWWQYILSISWGFLNLILDEIIPKPVYRRIVRRRLRKTPTGNGVDREAE
ncbi:MAG: hypothetical protein KVP17_004847 [Porospora cf. gigantea B]|uniref:uncharacterized protein n=2 Tax=Porospora cf. gigantea B TaxID=2853592 RepID=UPI003571CC35|nr:MAG: hypothetical protein KVP17_004847 [Porospora cf. gigantea B]